ncbi:hypothetical protein LCGC14_0320210 [marine sediment metagenome]|uniref:Glycosyl-4,4'-diaponeurosporenoate acyltransferase n=1 Tax=marine sediment metagenome TaxID=412755 RepID=A0A0F9WRM7_9ZZZZ
MRTFFKIIGYPIIYVATSGANLIGLIGLLFMYALGGHRFFTYRGALFMELGLNRWFTRKFYQEWGGSTFGPHMIMVKEDMDRPLWDAELRHGEQMTSEAFEKIAIGVVMNVFGIPWWIPATWWALGGLIAILMAMLTATLRGEHPYYGSHFEKAVHPRYREHP